MEEHPKADDKTIRRFVAGDVCLKDLTEFNDCFALPKVMAPRVTTWNLFLGEQISSKKRDFNEINQISEEYNAMKRNRSEEFVLLENKYQQEKQKMMEQQGDKKSISKRNGFYRKDLSALIKFCDVMYENYKTSILIYGATDTLYPKHCRPFQHANSVLAKQAEKTVLNYTEERDLQFILDDVIGAFGEKFLHYKGGIAYPSASASSSSAISTKKTDLILPFLEQALLAWKDVTGKAAATRVPWTKIFGNTDNEYTVTGWPETILKPIELPSHLF